MAEAASNARARNNAPVARGNDAEITTDGPAGDNASSATKSKKPRDSAFKQQRLPAWQPILTAGTVLPTFFVIGIAFIPIGIGMIFFSENVQEISIDYTKCPEFGNPQNATCDSIVNSSSASTTPNKCICHVPLTLDTDFEGNVSMYYGLTNFYQNHRRYVKSRDDSQLLGDVKRTPSDDCDPFKTNASGISYVPCGAIANSLFSDEIKLFNDTTCTTNEVKLIRRGIAWESDKAYKFKNPPIKPGETLQQAFFNTSKPKDWPMEIWELDTEDVENNGLQNEDLIVWMRTAALPNFRKLYRKIPKDETTNIGLKKGTYCLKINYRFRVTQFSGTKSVILSTTSLLGGKNPFLGIAYITVGSICLLMGVVFLFIHFKCGKQTNEMMNITSRTPYH